MIKVLFRVAYLYHLSTLLPIYNALIKDTQYDIKFTLPFKEREKKFLLFQKNVSYKYISLYKKMCLPVNSNNNKSFDIVITGDVLDMNETYGTAKIVLVNHGTGIKNVFYRLLKKQLDRCYYIMVEGNYRKNKILENNVQGNSKIFVVGYPKLDPVINSELDTNIYYDKFIKDSNKKTILYSPTYKPTSIPYLKNDILKYTQDYNLIIKLHPYSWKGKYAPHSHHRVFESQTDKYEHFVLVPKDYYDILPFIAISDLVITDASSIIFEFLALNKTGIIFDIPDKNLYHSDGEKILHESKNFLEGVFEHINAGRQLPETIKKAMFIDKNKQNLMHDYKNKLFFKLDGNASNRIKKIIEERIL